MNDTVRSTLPTKASPIPPFLQMMQLLSGFQVSQALYAVAELDVATVLMNGSRTVDELAALTGADRDALRRIIRFLETLGIFRMDEDTVEVTQLGVTLADGRADSVRGLARYWMETHYAPFGNLLHTARTGESAAGHFGMPFFDWVASNPRLVELQNAAMATGNLTRGAIFNGYRLPAEGTVADLGGADGDVLSQLLINEPERRGIVFDLPNIVAAAHKKLAAAGLTDRVTVVGGDLFESVPTADVYVMSVILHDWDDERCIRILRNITKAAPPAARLVLVEMVVPDDHAPHPAKAMDLAMLALLGGRERTAVEWETLLKAGGFTLDRIIPTPTPFAFIEATRH